MIFDFRFSIFDWALPRHSPFTIHHSPFSPFAHSPVRAAARNPKSRIENPKLNTEQPNPKSKV